jgi:cyclic pyranopterin phosphate synthase
LIKFIYYLLFYHFWKWWNIIAELSKKFRRYVPQDLKNIIKPAATRLLYKFYNKPLYIDIETITACNRRCSYCPNSIYDRGTIKNCKLMDESLYHKIIDELALWQFAGHIHPFWFGEPLLDKRLPDLISYTKMKLPKSTITVFTNGDLLTIQTFKKLKHAGVDGFWITQHDKSETQTMKEFKKYINENGSAGVKITYHIIDNYMNRGGLVNVNKKTYTPKYCLMPSKHITIDYAGNVVLCCNDYFSTISFGNLKIESLTDIWNKPSYIKIRKELWKGLMRHDMCKKCGSINPVEVM